MSGTSIDAIDVALLRFDPGQPKLLATHEHPLPAKLKDEIARISLPGENEIERLGVLDRELGGAFAEASLALLESEQLPPTEIRAIGSHGQTIRHRPPSGGHAPEQAFTLQIGDPNTIAELSGIDTVADFRRRDVAAGGEGAPLAPAFHRAVFSQAGINRAVVNIGGIANVSLLRGGDLIAGFDCGPGNTLLDQWHQRHMGEAFDRDGAWAAEGEPNKALLRRLLGHPYFKASGPRSTGKEMFNLPWLDEQLADTKLHPLEVQATLAEFTAASICQAIATSGIDIQEVFICGGGARNTDLMRRLFQGLKPAKLDSTEALGIHPDWVEAAAFAWLAHCSLESISGNAPVVTGASGERILGAVYPA